VPCGGDFGRWSPWGQFQRRLRAADALLYEEIERRRSAPDLDERTDVLSLLLRARDEQGESMSDPVLRDELMTMLLAGHETTATGSPLPSIFCPPTPASSPACTMS
jgi:cytochrome P450 family 110